MTDAFDVVWYNSKRMDKKTRAFVQALEKKLGYKVSITQGCYNPGGVGASAGTHDKGGMLDLPSNDREAKLKAIKDLGGFGWYRPAIAGLWGPHIHFGIADHGNMASVGVRQQSLYYAGRDGLKSNRADRSYRAKGRPVFKYIPEKVIITPPQNNITRMRDKLAEGIHDIKEAHALGSNAPRSRVAVWNQLDNLKLDIAELEARLAGLPKR